jgi:pimeloyl-ACP methyl ester carboxylesterase
MRRWLVAPLVFAAAVALTAGSTTPVAFAQDKKAKAVYPEPEQETVTTADGVKLRGLFHKSNSEKAAKNGDPVVILLYAPGAGKDMTKGDWAGLANRLNEEGYHVFRFDWRGHGKSTDIADVKKFWQTAALSAPTNNKYITGATKSPPKSTLVVEKDFGPGASRLPGYLPALVNDLAAVRLHLDQKNDNGTVNTSSVYLIGAGDAAALGMMWITSEWLRPAVMPGPNQLGFGVPRYEYVPQPLNGGLGTEAGETIAGAVWLTPAQPKAGLLANDATIRGWTAKMAPKLRDLNPMLFFYGDQDKLGENHARFYYNEVLVAEPRGSSLKKLDQTFIRPVANTKLSGVALLGNNAELKTEDTLVNYLAAIQKERARITRKQRTFTDPYAIDISYFLGGRQP